MEYSTEYNRNILTKENVNKKISEAQKIAKKAVKADNFHFYEEAILLYETAINEIKKIIIFVDDEKLKNNDPVVAKQDYVILKNILNAYCDRIRFLKININYDESDDDDGNEIYNDYISNIENSYSNINNQISNNIGEDEKGKEILNRDEKKSNNNMKNITQQNNEEFERNIITERKNSSVINNNQENSKKMIYNNEIRITKGNENGKLRNNEMEISSNKRNLKNSETVVMNITPINIENSKNKIETASNRNENNETTPTNTVITNSNYDNSYSEESNISQRERKKNRNSKKDDTSIITEITPTEISSNVDDSNFSSSYTNSYTGSSYYSDSEDGSVNNDDTDNSYFSKSSKNNGNLLKIKKEEPQYNKDNTINKSSIRDDNDNNNSIISKKTINNIENNNIKNNVDYNNPLYHYEMDVNNNNNINNNNQKNTNINNKYHSKTKSMNDFQRSINDTESVNVKVKNSKSFNSFNNSNSSFNSNNVNILANNMKNNNDINQMNNNQSNNKVRSRSRSNGNESINNKLVNNNQMVNTNNTSNIYMNDSSMNINMKGDLSLNDINNNFDSKNSNIYYGANNNNNNSNSIMNERQDLIHNMRHTSQNVRGSQPLQIKIPFDMDNSIQYPISAQNIYSHRHSQSLGQITQQMTQPFRTPTTPPYIPYTPIELLSPQDSTQLSYYSIENVIMEQPLGNEMPEVPPNKIIQRPFWMMRLLRRSMLNGGYLSPRIYVPRQLWFQQGVKYIAIDAKYKACIDVITHLQKIRVVEITDYAMVYEVLKKFERDLPSIRSSLAKKLKFIDEIYQMASAQSQNKSSSVITVQTLWKYGSTNLSMMNAPPRNDTASTATSNANNGGNVNRLYQQVNSGDSYSRSSNGNVMNMYQNQSNNYNVNQGVSSSNSNINSQYNPAMSPNTSFSAVNHMMKGSISLNDMISPTKETGFFNSDRQMNKVLSSNDIHLYNNSDSLINNSQQQQQQQQNQNYNILNDEQRNNMNSFINKSVLNNSGYAQDLNETSMASIHVNDSYISSGNNLKDMNSHYSNNNNNSNNSNSSNNSNEMNSAITNLAGLSLNSNITSSSKIIHNKSRLSRSMDKFTNKKGGKVRDITGYIEILVNLFQSAQFLEKWIEYFENLQKISPAEQYNAIFKMLNNISIFFSRVICAFVLKDYEMLVDRYMKKIRQNMFNE